MIEKRVVCFGEILWDNLKDGRRLGGAPLNVCYHLMKMGINSTIITQVGNDQNGKDILGELDRLNIDKAYCHTSTIWPTSTVEVHLSENGHISYDIVENVAWDHIEVSQSMEAEVAQADAFVFGSLITRSDLSCRSLYRLLEQSSFRVFDVNLRAPFYNQDIVRGLLAKTHLLKLNEEELTIIMKWLGEESSDTSCQLQKLQDHYPNIESILLTKGADGANYYSEGTQFSVKAMKVHVKDTVGSGDSFLAAFLAARLNGCSVEQALDSARLLSGFIASHHGACPHYEQSDLFEFKESLQLSIKNNQR